MATANDRAVLQTIFNPSTPFGDIPGLDEEEDDVQDEVEAFPLELLDQVRELELQGVSVQLVLLNPYSALCNQMLCEMLGRLRNPDGTGSD
ncbi:PREDICTED: tetratricopeptide repeat protein 36 [Corvus brachyrhynchos]|uniref:tetratricopeptide repeat protein 36 n=1 Tax=Corvus brachyrhynchos TaxID=85066 RepID=UPI0004DDE53B|nr:PREDICTED: tetratricopeptide repeat protein 36 [Corvus brachyrhynchos]